MLNTEQFAATNKANVETLLSLGSKTLEGVEQLTTLNLQVAKAGLGEAQETALAALSAKDPQALIALQTGLLQPAADKAAAYGRQVYDIVSATKAEFEKVAAEQAAGAQSSFLAAVEGLTKNAPEGATGGVAMFKSALTAANNAVESLQKAAKQAAEAAEANYVAATGAVVKAAKAKRA